MATLSEFFGRYEQLWGSTLSALDCTYVVNGIKGACIVFCRDEQLPLLRMFCRDYQVCFELSDHKMVSNPVAVKGSYVNTCRRVPTDSQEGKYVVFLSKKRLDAQLAKQHYADSNHRRLGLILGYPECCAEFFCRHVEEASKKDMDFILFALGDVKAHEFYTNRAIRYFGTSLISHFPCCLDCQESVSIAKRRLESLQQHFPQIAAHFVQELRSMVLYTEEQGIFYSTEYAVEGDRIRFNNLRGTVTDGLYHDLKRENEVTVESFDRIFVGARRIEGGAGILLFR